MADETFNVDDWLAGIRPSRQPVKIYQKPELAGRIKELEQQLDILTRVTDEDESLGGGEAAEIKEQIDVLLEEFHASGMTFWVKTVGPERRDAIHAEARKDLKAEADQAAKVAREEARELCKRQGITDTTQINKDVRDAASTRSESLIAYEYSLRLLSEAIDEPRVSPEALRTITEKLGEGQVQKLNRAFGEVTRESPDASLPKSSRRGTQENHSNPS